MAVSLSVNSFSIYRVGDWKADVGNRDNFFATMSNAIILGQIDTSNHA